MSEHNFTLGDGRVAALGMFNALDGYGIKADYIAALESDDDAKRRAILVRVLSHVTIDGKPLNGERAINEALTGWVDVEGLVSATLAANGITKELIRDEVGPKYAQMGKMIGVGFLESIVHLYGPVLERLDANLGKGEPA